MQIIRLEQDLEHVLMLIPIVAEWHERHGEKSAVETCWPSVFSGNQHVEKSGIWVDPAAYHTVVDLHDLWCDGEEKHPMDRYCVQLFGDTRLRSRRMPLFPNPNHIERAEVLWNRHPGDKSKAVVDLRDTEWCCMPDVEKQKLLDFMRDKFNCMAIDGSESIHVVHRAIAMADLYVGLDGNNNTALAMTTNTSMVCGFTCRNPKFHHPFRRSIPFRTVRPQYSDCENIDWCFGKLGNFEHGFVHRVKCPKTPEFICNQVLKAEQFIQAIEEIKNAKG